MSRYLLPMNAQPRLYTEACLLIFDPHQDVSWVRRIIDRERHNISHLVLGGDYFDHFHPENVGTVEQTCDLLLELTQEWGERITVLLGNHDIPYLEAKHWLDQGASIPELRYVAGGWDGETAKIIAKRLPWEFWRDCRLFQLVNGYLVSHAGLAGCFWYPELTVPEALDALDAHCRIALERVSEYALPILQCGGARGGHRPLGGITWLDFNFEFSDDEVPLPQIFGHTTSQRGARCRGRSWCLDGQQTCYGILHSDGRLEISIGAHHAGGIQFS